MYGPIYFNTIFQTQSFNGNIYKNLQMKFKTSFLSLKHSGTITKRKILDLLFSNSRTCWTSIFSIISQDHFFYFNRELNVSQFFFLHTVISCKFIIYSDLFIGNFTNKGPQWIKCFVGRDFYLWEENLAKKSYRYLKNIYFLQKYLI